jgi:replicative superfamily II helicase
VLATRRKALLVLPFVAVVREKVEHLRKLLTSYNIRRGKREAIRVREFHGGKGGKGFGACLPACLRACVMECGATEDGIGPYGVRVVLSHLLPFVHATRAGRSHIGVCTIEKANSLVNKLIQDGSIRQLTCLVVDEMHMMGGMRSFTFPPRPIC